MRCRATTGLGLGDHLGGLNGPRGLAIRRMNGSQWACGQMSAPNTQPTGFLFLFFFSQPEWVVIWRRLLGQFSDILGIAVIGTAQQQDAGRFWGVGEGRGVSLSEFDGSACSYRFT